MSTDAEFHWLLDVPSLGLRYAVDALEVPTAAGDVLAYAPGLEPIEMGQGDPDVDVHVDSVAVDWPRVAPLLDGAQVALRRWREGTVFEQAETYAKGTATEAEWETREDPVEWTVRSVETVPPIPASEARVSNLTTVEEEGVTSIPAGQTGMFYPIVFGYPGYRPVDLFGGGEFPRYVVPVPMRILYAAALDVLDSQIVVSAQPGRCLPATVRISEDHFSEVGTLDVIATVDDLGQAIGVATLTAEPRLFTLPDEGPRYFASYSPSGGGATTRNAYDVVVAVLEDFGGDTVDWARVPEIRDHLIGWMVDTWISEPLDAPPSNADTDPRLTSPDAEGGGVYGWLVGALGVAAVGSTEAAGLPIALRTSAAGRYFVPLRYDVDPARTVRTVDVSRGEASRVSGVRARGTPVNSIAVAYADEEAFGAYVGIPPLTTSAGLDIFDEMARTGFASSGLAGQSFARYGRRFDRVDAPWTWDAATAIRLGLHRLERDALPWRFAQYVVPEEWGLREGDQVRLVDADVALDELAIVDGPPFIGEDGFTVTLRMPGVP